MFQGNWTCSKCGGEIKELPFEPRSNSGLTCRECYFKEKDGGAAESAPEADAGMNASSDDRADIPDFDPSESSMADEPQADDGLDGAKAAPAGEKPMFEGDWKCSGCGAAITSLPFKPYNTENLKCLDCFKNSKG